MDEAIASEGGDLPFDGSNAGSHRLSLDWPLSREEKRSCALRLYEQDVQVANQLLHKKDAELRALRSDSSASSCVTTCRVSGSDRQSDAGSGVQESKCGDGNGWRPPSLDTRRAAADRLLESAPSSISAVHSSRATASVAGGTRPNVGDLDVSNATLISRCGPLDRAGLHTELDIQESDSEANIALLHALAQTRLHAALVRFYRGTLHGQTVSLADMAELASLYGGEGTPELWAMIAAKYSLPPRAAVYWLTVSTGPFVPVQWPKGAVPEVAWRVLGALASQVQGGMGPGAGGSSSSSSRSLAVDVSANTRHLKAALQRGCVDSIRALVFHGCHCDALRPQVWRTLLGTQEEQHEHAVQAARQAYCSVRAAVLEAASAARSGTISSGAEVFVEAEAAAEAACRGNALLGRPRVAEALLALTLVAASRNGGHRIGVCEMAALLLHVHMQGSAATSEHEEQQMVHVEADAFWCLHRLLELLDDRMNGDNALEEHTRLLLQAYDPALAKLLVEQHLEGIVAARFGIALGTCAGFGVTGCLRLWDALLADPLGFGLLRVLPAALLLLSRSELLALREAGSCVLQEALLACPGRMAMSTLIRFAQGLCVFDAIVAGAVQSLTHLFVRQPPWTVASFLAREAAHGNLATAAVEERCWG
eukprot:CAMPEP_0172728496 /NCGR_PEP_ID=MMETSP1074-20121228/92273_1 /TAXON_ID=2916 /ORGANISM="Ceratium fusus, Strain PA161109" /LENGTH=651 /DNA_ID=CAMNT_0013555753 /DNA_START=82 /DNA_END=2034 /DNA_ORIENTATION=-